MCAQRDWRFDPAAMRIRRVGCPETCPCSEPSRPSPLLGAVWMAVALYAVANVIATFHTAYVLLFG